MISFGRAPCDEGVIRAAAETPGCAEHARPWVLAATILGSSMAFIDGSVVTVALPAIQADLNTSVAGAQWVTNTYTHNPRALILATAPTNKPTTPQPATTPTVPNTTTPTTPSRSPQNSA